ncbi:MAG: hypothetical protein K0B08_12280 [Bacteroidales bacterium]|nr:hypothetical protein [Bacteroidales bacterium]
MTAEKKNKIRGIAGTVIFHVILLLLLFFLALRTPLPLPGEEGVLVNLGFDETGMEFNQQTQPAPAVPTPQPQPVTPQVEEEKYLVQDIEEAPAIVEKKVEKKKEPVKVIPKPVPDPQPVPEPVEPEPQPQVNPKALYPGKSKSTTEGGQEGQTGQPGDQGSPYGTPGVDNYEGTGGAGDGISYSLGGRGKLSLYKPSYESREQGKVVVTIRVDRQGNVVSAVPGARGTNVSDQRLWEVSKDAALRSTFVPDPNAPDNQVGTITYNFIRQN